MNRIRHAIEFSLSLAKVQFKERNEGSYLGILWYLLNPLLTFMLLLLIFHDRVGSEISRYPLYLLMGVIMFNYFQIVTTESTTTIPANKSIIKSVNFPRIALVGSTGITHIFSHIFEMILVVIFFSYYKVTFSGLIFYPVVFFLFAVFVFGMSLMLAAVHVYFIDLKNIWSFVSRLIWLGTPIFYSVGGQKRLMIMNLFNPVYFYITMARQLIVYQKIPSLWIMMGGVFYSLVFLAIGLFIFNRLKNKFAELI